MDMTGMDMGDMGTDGGQEGLFTATNRALARDFWYGVTGCVAILALRNGLAILQSRHRRRCYLKDQRCVPSRPQGWVSQAYATVITIARELSYPQPVYFTGRISKYFSPLPLGKWLILTLYWVVVLTFLWANTILKTGDPMYAYKWEKVGFRAAWVSITQIPLIYLLSCKFNPISLLTGISYERFNWLHRWSARTMFLTIIVHWSFFFREWSLADIVSFEFQMMPMVKYGFAAWGIITWMVLSGLGFFRSLNYEFFVLQHIAAAGALLWCLHMHVPSYAAYNVWMAVGIVAFDWGVRIVWGILRNTHVLGGTGTASPGYSTSLEVLPGDVVRLTIEGVDFGWKAGQHAYIVVPKLRPFEAHPFTIANTPTNSQSVGRRHISMVVQARSGFSKSLLRAALRSRATNGRYRSFVSGPWGSPPDLTHYETVVLIACSTGVTFVMPLLQSLVARHGCVDKIDLHWIIRHQEHLSWFKSELDALLLERSPNVKLRLRVNIHVTRPGSVRELHIDQSKSMGGDRVFLAPSTSSSCSEDGSDISSVNEKVLYPTSDPLMDEAAPSLIINHRGRPDVESMIRPAVEGAYGETAVVVCGGLSITAQSRTFVAALSDERAVHKGTGAQGIFLFTETYGW